MTWCPPVAKLGLVLLLLAAPLTPALAAPQIEAKSFTIPSREPGICGARSKLEPRDIC